MRLPRDPDNWTPHHCDLAMARAWREYDRYEARINFDWPPERQEECYAPYNYAKHVAEEVCGYVWQSRSPARALP